MPLLWILRECRFHRLLSEAEIQLLGYIKWQQPVILGGPVILDSAASSRSPAKESEESFSFPSFFVCENYNSPSPSFGVRDDPASQWLGSLVSPADQRGQEDQLAPRGCAQPLPIDPRVFQARPFQNLPLRFFTPELVPGLLSGPEHKPPLYGSSLPAWTAAELRQCLLRTHHFRWLLGSRT